MASITSLIILGIVLCNALNSNISIEATFSCNSYTSGSITPSHDTIFYLFNNSEQEYNESYSVLFDLCPSTFDTILYLYDQDLNELYCNDDSDSCNGHQSQLLFYLSQPLYIIQIGGHNSEFGTFYLNITCNYNDALHPPSIFITNQPTSLTLEPSYAPSHPPSDPTPNELYCDGMITSDFQLPAGVCLRFGSLYGYMYKCNNGRMSRIVWRDSIDCMGKYSFIDENYCSDGTCLEYCGTGPCQYYTVTQYNQVSYCDGDIPRGNEIWSNDETKILNYCHYQWGYFWKYIVNGSYIQQQRYSYSSPDCNGHPDNIYDAYKIGLTCANSSFSGISSKLVIIGTAPGTKAPSNSPTSSTLSPTYPPSVHPTMSTYSPSYNPTISTEPPTTAVPTSETLSPTTYNPTVPPTTYAPSNAPTLPPNDLPCDGIIVDSQAIPAGVCMEGIPGSQMYECTNDGMFLKRYETRDCSGASRHTIPAQDYCGILGNTECEIEEFCGIEGECDYWRLKHYSNVSYCDLDGPVGTQMTAFSVLYVLDYCHNTIHNTSFKYILDTANQYIQQENYNSFYCSKHSFSFSGPPYFIGETCALSVSVGVTGTESPTPLPTASAAPTKPTLSPTHSKRELCGRNKWCYYVNLYPIFRNQTSQTVGMANANELDEDTELQIQFTSKYEDCVAPVISVSFEEIDFGAEYEYFEIFDDNDEFIYKCNGTRDGNCGHWIQCLDHSPLGINKIAAETTYNLTIKTSGLNARCSSDIHSYSANIGLTMICSSETATPTTEPTIKPTEYPTFSIFTNRTVYGISCGDQRKDALRWSNGFALFYRLTDTLSIGTNVLIEICNMYSEGARDLNIYVFPISYTETILTEIPEPLFSVAASDCNKDIYQHQLLDPDIFIAISPNVTNNGTVNGYWFPYNMTISCYTNDPTSSPTAAPTRYPTTMDAYDSYFDIEYKMDSISKEYNDYMAQNSNQFLLDLTEIIETEHATQDINYQIKFRDFWLNLGTINGKSISELLSDGLWFSYSSDLILIMEAKLLCSRYICNQIFGTINKTSFRVDITYTLIDYFSSRITNINVNANSESMFEFSIVSIGDVTDDKMDVENLIYLWIFIPVCAILIILIICFIYKTYKRRKIMEAKTIKINNAMVVSISIGVYDENPIKPEVDAYVNDLEGVRIDIQNAIKMYGKKLNYDIYPKIYKSQNVSTYKAHWTESELIEFLKTKSDELEANLQSPHQYDGLVVMISCHGFGSYILTSDYKKVNKTAIHRIFSAQKPLSRTIPRIFLFDCCSGSNERGYTRRSQYENNLDIDEDEADEYEMETPKNTEVDDITREDSVIWFSDEDNPDFRLVTIHAANEGFQSKMRTDTGSYVITEFLAKLDDNIHKNNNKQFLNEILDEIQEELHERGKQLIVKTFNNKTEYIKFGIRNIKFAVLESNKTREDNMNTMEMEMMTVLNGESTLMKNADNIILDDDDVSEGINDLDLTDDVDVNVVLPKMQSVQLLEALKLKL